MEKTDFKKVATRREMVMGGLVVLVLMIAFFRVAYPLRSTQVKDLKEKIKTLEQERLAVEKQTKELEGQVRQREVQKDKMANAQLQILNRQMKPGLSKMIELMALMTTQEFRHGMDMSSVSTQRPLTANGFTKSALQIKGRGSFAQLAGFMTNMEQLPALISVDSVLLDSDEEAPGFMNMDMMITLYELEGFNATTAQN